MYTGQIDQISNQGDWTGPFCQIVDQSDGSIINILNADVAFDCNVYIKDFDNCTLVTGNISNGKVVASSGDDGPGFQWQFKQADLGNLCAGTYRFMIQTTTNGEVNVPFDGTVAVTGDSGWR
jgi:hypothetical protein